MSQLPINSLIRKTALKTEVNHKYFGLKPEAAVIAAVNFMAAAYVKQKDETVTESFKSHKAQTTNAECNHLIIIRNYHLLKPRSLNSTHVVSCLR